MRAFSSSTIRNVLKAIEHSGDRIDMLALLMANEDNQLSIVNMLTAEPVKVEVLVDKVRVVFAADTYEPSARYQFVCIDEQNFRKINCIKHVRQIARIGLKEAKDLVEGQIFKGFGSQLFESNAMADILTFGYCIEKVR